MMRLKVFLLRKADVIAKRRLALKLTRLRAWWQRQAEVSAGGDDDEAAPKGNASERGVEHGGVRVRWVR
jgi:hypothetical protein